jgi:hypothetical protein
MTAEMNPEVVRVRPEPDYTLHLWFDSGEQGILDMKPYLDGGPVFRALRDPAVFNSVHPCMGPIQWNNNADLGPDTVYLDSVKI